MAMTAIFIRCSKSGWQVPADIDLRPDAQISAGEFYAYSRCSYCGADHEWTDKNLSFVEPDLLQSKSLPFAA